MKDCTLSRNKRRQKTRFIYTKILDTLTCQICGEGHNAVLDFHHLDATTKEISVSDLKSKDYSATRIVEEISKCACLCSNCHRRIHHENKSPKVLHKESINRLTKTVNLAIVEWNKKNTVL
jgi:hypothetical protein